LVSPTDYFYAGCRVVDRHHTTAFFYCASGGVQQNGGIQAIYYAFSGVSKRAAYQ
jgi:hypothetical protein